MSWIDGMRHRLRTLFNPAAYDREIDEELWHHLELGARDEGDVDAARRHFGNRTWHKEEARRMTWLGSLDVLWQDARYAIRAIQRTPGFTATIVVTLALGIGVNAAVFSVLDRIYLRPPTGVADPGGVRRIWVEHHRTADGVPFVSPALNYPMYRDIAAASGNPAQIAVFTTNSQLRLGGTRKGVLTDLTYASASYFPLLGVRPALGRFYTPDEDQLGAAAHVAVVSHYFWRTYLGGDSAIVGRTIQLDTARWQVIGVAQDGFIGIDLKAVNIWVPLGAYPTPSWMKTTIWASPAMFVFQSIVRTGPGTDPAAFLQRANSRVLATNRALGNFGDTLMTVATGSVLQSRGPQAATREMVISSRLQGVAVIVLLIACANVVNLMLARAVKRRREIAVRLALGISRGRLMRLLTTESLLLALVAFAAALIAAWWGGSLLRSQLLPDIEWTETALHGRVAVAAMALALVSGFVAGIIPAMQFTSPDLSSELKSGVREGGYHRPLLRDGLVVAQAAFSVVLLVGAALFVRSLHNVEELDLGFDASQLLFGHVSFEPGQRPPDVEIGVTMRDVVDRLRSRPGIEAVSRAGNDPMSGLSFWTFYWGSDSSQSIKRDFPVGHVVAREYFGTVGLRMLRGRTFDIGDNPAPQVVVNEPMARLLWPHLEALGQCLRLGQRTAPCLAVVGVVEAARRDRIIEGALPQYYLPLGLPETRNWGGSALIVRVRGRDASAAEREIQAVLKQEFPAAQPVVRAMTQTLEPQYRPWRLAARLFTAFGLLALVVALVGIYSTVSYSVGQRTREFGVRVALGARTGDVVNQVLGEAVRLVAIGTVVGVVLAVAAGRLVSALLFGVVASDPSALMLAACTLLLVSSAAAALPAWRAARANPLEALRAE